jgi:hypothetical protein
VPYTINQQQIDNVLSLPAADRYGHFIRRVADWEELWGLKSEQGWVTVRGDGGSKCLPLWPHPDYAKLSVAPEWREAVPERIELSRFMSWLHQIEQDGYLIAVFPTPAGLGVVVKPEQIRVHLAAECEQYE